MLFRRFTFNQPVALIVLLISRVPMASAQQLDRSAAAPTPQENVPNAPAKKAAPGDDRLIPRTYEVGDLILRIQDHPYSESLQQTPRDVGGGSGVGGGGGGFFSVPDRDDHAGNYGVMQLKLTQFGGGGGEAGERLGISVASEPPAASITIDDIVRVLMSTVARDSWAENGGEGQIEPLGTALVVSQTSAVHEQINELLTQLRESTAERRTVTIDARWLLLSSDELDSLLRADEGGMPFVHREKLAEFTRRPESMRGMTNCFSSQLVYLVSGTRRNIVSGYIPVVGALESPKGETQLAAAPGRSVIRLVADQQPVSGKSVGYQPIVETSNLGALLEIRPTLMPKLNGERFAVVDLKSTVTGPGEGATTTDDEASAALAPQVDRVAVEAVEFATSLRMPLGNPILVGGLSYAPTRVAPNGNGRQPEEANQRPADASRQLYLVLEVR
jgi:hypothetical protein